MESFLVSCRHKLSLLEKEPVRVAHVVIGNESCDLDSVVCALVQGFTLQKQNQKAEHPVLVIPVLNVTREQLSLRTEVMFWLQDAVKLDLSIVLCKNEVPWHQLIKMTATPNQSVRLTIVDHNQNKDLEKLFQLIQIVDHHQKMRTLPSPADEEIDTNVGSCASLVAKRYLDCINPDCDSGPDVQIALLLYGPIILDLSIATQLERIMSSESMTRQEVYQQLTHAKNQVPTTFNGYMEKDLKTVREGKDSIAISSISGHLVQDSITSFPDPFEQLESYRVSNHLAAIILMGIRNSDPQNVQRDILLFSPDSNLLAQLIHKLDAPSSDLRLKPVQQHRQGSVHIFSQGNTKSSRKVVLTLVSDLMKAKRGSERPSNLQQESLSISSSSSSSSHVSSQGRRKSDKFDTCNVDPNFALNYDPGTISVPDSPQFHMPGIKSESPMDVISSPSATTTSVPSPNVLTGVAEPLVPKGRITHLSQTTQILPPSSSSQLISPPNNHPHPHSLQLNPAIYSHNSLNPVNGKSHTNQPLPSPFTTSLSSNAVIKPVSVSTGNSSGQQAVSKGNLSSAEPTSINYYESYFDDSYVGDFSGEVDVQRMNEREAEFSQQMSHSHWSTDPDLKLNNLMSMEFSYDSFGPESIVYSGIDIPSQSQSNHFGEPVQSDNPSSSLSSSPLFPPPLSTSSQPDQPLLSKQQVPSHHQHPHHHPPSSPSPPLTSAQKVDFPDQETSEHLLMSLSITEPQLRDKLNRCFDDKTIRDVYGSTMHGLEEEHSDSRILNHHATNGNRDNHLDKDNNPIISHPDLKPSHMQNGYVDNNLMPNIKTEPTSPTPFIQSSDMKKEPVDSVISQMDEISLSPNNLLSMDPLSTSSFSPPPVLSSGSSERDSLNSPYPSFSRNNTLTRSQRRRIKPSLPKFETVLNTEDSVLKEALTSLNPLINQVSDDTMLDGRPIIKDPLPLLSELTGSDPNNSSPSPTSLTPTEGYQSRMGTLKKKITINKEFLNNEEPGLQDQSAKILVTSADKGKVDDDDDELDQLEDLPSDANHVGDSSRWGRSCPIGSKGESKPIDLKVIEPYKKVISHAGYYNYNLTQSVNGNECPEGPGPAIITFSACYLPDRSRKDYSYVMDHLFMYVLTTLHELVADDYILIYFHNPTGSGQGTGNNMPTFGWLKRCYYMIDRKLRKNLKALYLVHPTFWLKTLVIMTKPLLSTKFSHKLKFVSHLKELNELVPMAESLVPPPVKQMDDERFSPDSKKRSKCYF